jgi:hypothetical protein
MRRSDPRSGLSPLTPGGSDQQHKPFHIDVEDSGIVLFIAFVKPSFA